MKGDFSTDRFDPAKNYTRVLKQQGRVELDSDWNESGAISTHLLRTFIRDLIGPHGGPAAHCGFGLLEPDEGQKPVVGDFLLGPGRYYVDGILIENPSPVAYSVQPYLQPAEKLETGHSYLVYLDVWERHVTYIEDHGIREVALGGPDTCTRAQAVWQVRAWDLQAKGKSSPAAAKTKRPAPAPAAAAALPAEVELRLKEAYLKLEEARKNAEQETDPAKQATLRRTIERLERTIKDLQASYGQPPSVDVPGTPPPPVNRPEMDPVKLGDCGEATALLNLWRSGTLAARVEPSEVDEAPCVLPPESRYRGLENHLYRIEIHQGGDTSDVNRIPTFKWSRENGSVVTRWLATIGSEVQVEASRGFAAGDYVELSTEWDDLNAVPGVISRVLKVDGDRLTLEAAPAWKPDLRNPKVRRWDQSANDEQPLVGGVVPIQPGTADNTWVAIENGIEVQFSPGEYRTGDYWLIPARVVTGTIHWPVMADGSAAHRYPAGVAHHYAPLFVVEATATAPFVKLVSDCRCRFAALPCLEAKS